MTAPAREAERLGELLKAATPGPWLLRTNRHTSTNGESWGWISPDTKQNDNLPGLRIEWNGDNRGKPNAALIVAAVNALPGLLAERAALLEAALNYMPGVACPDVSPGGVALFIAAVRRNGRQTIYTMPAYYLNAFPLVMNDGDGCGKCPDDGSHDEGCPQTGWHSCKEFGGYDDFYEQLLGPGDELVAWSAIPQYRARALVGGQADGK